MILNLLSSSSSSSSSATLKLEGGLVTGHVEDPKIINM